MILRDTFLYDGHLWVVISEPGLLGEIAIVNFTHWEDNRDPSCIVEKHEHVWLEYERSIVFYKFAEVLTPERQAEYKLVIQYQEPVSEALLMRILEGTDSDRCPQKVTKLAMKTARRLRALQKK